MAVKRKFVSEFRIGLVLAIFALVSACSNNVSCLNNGTCENHNNGSSSCVCQPGFTGPRCENNITTSSLSTNSPVNTTTDQPTTAPTASTTPTPSLPCDSSPCLNNATCINVEGNYTCNCTDSYTGRNCDIYTPTPTPTPPCDSSPCTNNGICLPIGSSYYCVCSSSFTGSNCETEVNECISSACKNGGTCIDQKIGYTCQCHRGFFGSSCQHIDPCFFKPCRNNGRCERNVTTPNDYTCDCPSGYTGDRCEQDNSFLNTMYPFGPNENDLLMPEGRLYSFMCFGLGIPGPGLEFFGRRHASFSICRNGMILFDENYSRTWPRRFGLRYWDRYLAALAPYWSIIEDDRLFDSSTVFTFEGSLFDEIRSNRKRPSAHSRKTYRMRIDPKRQSKVYYHLYSRWNNNNSTAAMLTKASEDVKKYSGNSMFNDFKASFVAVITWVNLYPARIRTFPYFSLSNTFQAVIITDGVYTFLMYNYPSGGIQWAVPVDSSEVSWVNRWYRSPGLPVAGWNSGSYERNRFFNIRQSSSLAIAQLSRLPGNTQETGRWFFRIEESSSRREAEKKCYTWYQQQPGLVVPPLRPCACSMFQALRDRRFRFDWRYHREFPISSRGFCFLRRRFFRPIYLYHIINDDTNFLQLAYGRWSQRCCYSNDIFDYGSLLIGAQNGGHAQLELYNTFYRPIGVILSDEEAYKACCVDSELCHLFYRRRPSDTCWRYRPPRRRWFWGDPHIVTLDNKNYTFNGLGEYLMADVQNGFFQLQARTAKATGGVATVFSAAVAKEQNTSTIEARLSSSQSGLDVLVDGSPFNYSSITNGSVEIGNLSITRDENSGVSATFPSGISVTFSEVKGMMTIVIAAPDSFRNKTRGLLGVWNDDPSDDFTLPDGTVIPASSTDRVIHNEFGLKWQITAEQSLFTYKPGQGVDTFKNLSYTPLFADELNFTDPDLEAKARETCGSDLACLFDIAATKDVSVGQATLTTSQKLVNESNQLENFPPTLVNASSIIELTLNKKKEFELVANDTNGDQIVFLPPSLPGLQTSVSGNTLTTNWTLSSTNKVNFTVVVRDSKGASVIWSPTILVCACQNGGNCSRPDNLNGDQFQVMSCKCASGYTGRLCDSNLNACDFNGGPCFPGVNCTDLPPPSGVNGYECGLCPAGYSGNGANCTDIDECLDSGRCSQLCVNTPGLYFCQCNAGYNLNSDGKTCDDVDECQRPGTCMHKCTNTAGSYACTCNQAFKKDPNDPSRCVPTSPCSAGDNGCQQVCYVENNQNKCSCHKGYELQPDQKICKDVDECLVKPCTQLCRNTEGGYTCYCKQGFKLKTDNVTCEDINECAEGNYTCSDPFHQCINIEGGYKCECEQGSYWYNGSCHDVGKNTTKPESDPPTPREASTEEEDEAVEIRVKNMPKNKWKATRDKIFKRTVASLVSTYCSTNREECGLPPKRRSRRAIDENLYTENQVHLLPGYPKQDGADLIVVFYVQTPPGIVSAAVAVPAKVVVEILKNNQQKVEESLEGRTVSYIKPYKSKPDVPDASDRTVIWIVIGVCCAVLVCLIILVIFCVRRKKKQKSQKRSYSPSNHPYGVTNGGWNEEFELDGVESKNSITEHEVNTASL